MKTAEVLMSLRSDINMSYFLNLKWNGKTYTLQTSCSSSSEEDLENVRTNARRKRRRIQSLEKIPPINRNRRNKQPSSSYKSKGLKKSTAPVLKSYLSSTTPTLTPLPSQVSTDGIFIYIVCNCCL